MFMIPNLTNTGGKKSMSSTEEQGMKGFKKMPTE